MPDFRSLPSVNELANELAAIEALRRFPYKLLVEAARRAIDEARISIQNGKKVDVQSLAISTAFQISIGSIRTVQNFSGVILHTGLGRAPLPPPGSSIGYVNLEIDLETGKRGDRQIHVKEMFQKLTGAEDALVVNNGAAAVLLALSALCARKEVLLSRGQSVEIGGSFRMPDVIKAGGCKLVDVGTTNKTRVQDYVDAITSKTCAIVQCHPSNFEIKGFTESPTTEELAAVAHENGLILINDQGNGALHDFQNFGIHGVDTLPLSVAAGADITIGSGDKLLGGPQCGIILGRSELIAKMRRHPLARALRIDKTNLAYLHSTLQYYLFEDLDKIPLMRLLRLPAETVHEMCEAMAPDSAEILEAVTEIGSGAAPGQGVKSFAIVLDSKKPDNLLKDLRKHGYIGRIHKGKVWLDPRTAYPMFDLPTEMDANFYSTIYGAAKNIFTTYWEKWK